MDCRGKARSRRPYAPAVIMLAASVLAGGCFYSFRGTSVPEHMKTIAIPVFDDQSGVGEAGLREKVTRDLTQLFINDNTLQVTDRRSANAVLEGSIASIQDQPAVVTPGESVSKRRVTVTVHATLEDMVLHRKMWEKDFSNWGEYSSGGGLSQRTVGIDDALAKIEEDILLATVSGW